MYHTMKKTRRLLYIPWLYRYLEIQLFLNLASLPLLIGWGLPFSLMTPVSNLIFNPFLFIILFLSSLIFFSELFFLPNRWLIFFFEQITLICKKIFSWGSPSWLIELPNTQPLILIFFPLSALYILHSRFFNSPLKRIIGFSTAMITLMTLLIFVQLRTSIIDTIQHNKGNLVVLRAHNQTTIIDPGCIGQRISSLNWVEYNLISHLIAHYGTSTIDHLIILQPNKLALECLNKLCQLVDVKQISLPYWTGETPKPFMHQFMKLRTTLNEKHALLTRLGTQKKQVRFGNSACITIVPETSKITYKTINYPAYHFEVTAPEKIIKGQSLKSAEIDNNVPSN